MHCCSEYIKWYLCTGWSLFLSQLFCCDCFFCVLSCANIHHFFKYLPLFVLRPHWPDDLATDHLPPDICHPGQTEVAATGIFKIFASVLSYTHVGKANISHFLVLSFTSYIFTLLTMFCLDSFLLRRATNKRQWLVLMIELSKGCLTNSTPVLATAFWCLLSDFWFLLFGWCFCLELPTYVHNDLIDLSTCYLSNSTPLQLAFDVCFLISGFCYGVGVSV